MATEKKVTPMMEQYNRIKAQHQDKVLFFRLGDFYEMFDDDAVEVSRLLNITLTKRGNQLMCGIPHHASKIYIKRLLDAGRKIAICEQIALPQNAKEIATREVVQIVSPATVIEDDFLDASSNSYVLCVSLQKSMIAISYADITSGEFVLRTIPSEKQYTSLLSVLEQVGPREVLVDEDDYFSNTAFKAVIDGQEAMVTKLPPWYFTIKDGYEKMCSQVGTTSLKAFSLNKDSLEIASGGALIRYLEDSAKTALAHITHFTRENEDQYLRIDEASRKGLELLSNNADSSAKYTLYSAINATLTSAGARLLKRWITFPLVDVVEILERQRWVSFFVQDRKELERVRSVLKGALDMERLTSRIAMGRSTSRDLVGISQTVHAFFSLFNEQYQPLLDMAIAEEEMLTLVSLVKDLDKAINEDHQGPFQEGQVILDGFDASLDELRSIKGGGKQLLDAYLAKIREETGISTLKLSSNKILGHYLEVSKAQTDKVPSSFYRKQTLVNAERYTSDSLIECEQKILVSSSEAEKRERLVYETLLDQTKAMQGPLLAIATLLSRVDCLQGFATTANKSDYTAPTFVESNCLVIEGGRHPVVEQQLGIGAFVPNDLTIEEEGQRFCLITGPNMAGKSTYLRQNALIVLLSQIGSFVPARKVELSVVDRLFCRVGSSDNLARGESTFLVEMQEAAHILRSATRSSLVIVDELGRGTSTQDGMSLAYAMMQTLLELQAKTLFATHYHELAHLDNSLVQLLTLQVLEQGSSITFVRKVIKGIADSSYGLNVAKMAGVPAASLRKARFFQKKHFAEYGIASPQLELFADNGQTNESDLPTLTTGEETVLDRIRDFSVESSSPLSALVLLEQLKALLEAE
ncbi:MAG TPA: DNA mismatch repair protein MutS [Sphaerochaeta sp.]|nr:DNA mismatch repair protein MutS [Sphaerochaeta sp.]